MSANLRPTLTRDQSRAIHAYESVGGIAEKAIELRQDYRIAVNDFGANILRSGLAAAMAVLERQRNPDAVQKFLEHLAAAEVPELESSTGPQLPDHVRGLDVGAYMIASREFLRVAAWFRRAIQALLPDDTDQDQEPG